MQLFNKLFLLISCLLISCQAQYYRYPAQRRNGYSYSRPSSSYYQSSANRNAASTSSYNSYNSLSTPSYTNSYYKQNSQRNSYPYSSSTGSYTSQKSSAYPYSSSTGSYTSQKSTAYPYAQTTYANSINRNYQASSANRYPKSSYGASTNSYNSASDAYNKQYLSNSYNEENLQKATANASKYPINKADSENAKFAGAENQENDEEGRTALLKLKKLKKYHRRYGSLLGNPCSPFGRDASGGGVTPPPSEQGRFLWDVNVYNVYSQGGGGCGGYGYGGGFNGIRGGGLLSDPIAPPLYPPGTGVANFLSLFAPGILQNSLAATARPQQFADYGQQPLNDNGNDLQSDPEVDPNYRPEPAPAPLPVRRPPNRVYYDSAGAPPVTPGQLLGGISTTVNGIIQQLSGNVQPVYG